MKFSIPATLVLILLVSGCTSVNSHDDYNQLIDLLNEDKEKYDSFREKVPTTVIMENLKETDCDNFHSLLNEHEENYGNFKTHKINLFEFMESNKGLIEDLKIDVQEIKRGLEDYDTVIYPFMTEQLTKILDYCANSQ